MWEGYQFLSRINLGNKVYLMSSVLFCCPSTGTADYNGFMAKLETIFSSDAVMAQRWSWIRKEIGIASLKISIFQYLQYCAVSNLPCPDPRCDIRTRDAFINHDLLVREAGVDSKIEKRSLTAKTPIPTAP